MKIAVIGYGNQGKKLAQKFHELGVLTAIADPDELLMTQAASDHEIPTRSTMSEVLELVDAVVIATSTDTHHKLTLDALTQGKDVFVEKPLTNDHKLAVELVQKAAEHERILMVGHNTIYSPNVAKLKERNFIHYRSIRTNPNGMRKDDSAIWRLLPHDIAMGIYLFDAVPIVEPYVFTIGKRPIVGASVELDYGDGRRANCCVDWTHDEKIRLVELTDDGGNMVTLEEEGVDTLSLECQHFINCVNRREKPITDGEFGAKVVEVLEWVEKLAYGEEYGEEDGE